jgi:hypothetical protein
LKNRGYDYAIVATILFGASTATAKDLLQKSSPRLLAGLLYLGSGLGLLLVKIIGRAFRPSRTAILRGRDWFRLGDATVFGGVLGRYC